MGIFADAARYLSLNPKHLNRIGSALGAFGVHHCSCFCVGGNGGLLNAVFI